jgi:hypothetical protein
MAPHPQKNGEPAGAAGRIASAVAGDDPEAKATDYMIKNGRRRKGQFLNSALQAMHPSRVVDRYLAVWFRNHTRD